ncbi:SVSP family protein [Theileria parva strain Muguga]|uniref:Theileria-specific sub-telomeric protein, SVSP family n=1 Tax=Theileria parva TaxID=5875 RepID=Q4N6D1_THEPA|nr:SVSP family protein [Theileria parva strain Muguga]EAN32292.1 SVSP family protein [Theileria parva strain Muguga]|eukprot:XP_764575.1 hypothetical protein [Theileria parva strain Muguga]
MRCVTYKCILIFIIIKYVESQDNNPDQPADEEDEDDNFEVLDLEQIIQERISRFDDPRYQPQYQQLEESQYPPQPQAQPQYYDLDQGETQGYQTQPQYYDVYQPQQYGPYQTPQFQTHPLEQQPYVPVTHPQTITQEQEQTQQQVSQYYYYGSETQDPYGYQQPYGTQSLYDTGQQPITDTQTQEQYYGPPPTQPSQPQYQHYEPSHPTQQQSYQYYGPPTPIQSQPQQVPQQQYYQHYVPTLTQTSTQPSYQYYDPYEPPQTYQPQEQYYGPPQPQPQPSYQHYVPSQPQVTQQPQTQPQPQTPSQPPITQPPQPQPQTIEDDDNFYVTEHAYAQQPQPQKKQRKRKKPTKRKQIQPPSGDQSDEISLSEDDEQRPVKRKKCKIVKKTKHIKFYKIDIQGNPLEMNEGDYNVTFNDKDKKKYLFISNLERIECDGEIIFEHSSGNPYSSSLTHSKRTNIIIITISEGFILIKKSSGEWERTDYKIPDYVKLFTQDDGGNDVLLTSNDYDIDFTSKASFRYAMRPGVKCTKIIVNGLVAWKKTNKNDDGSPLVIYVTPKLRVIIDFEGYYKLLEIRGNRYKLSHTKKISKGSKHS